MYKLSQKTRIYNLKTILTMCRKSLYEMLLFKYKYKPGQLVTINGRLYRIKKYPPNAICTLKCECHHMEDCNKAMHKLICAYFSEKRNIKFLIPSCSNKLINEGKGRYLELVSE